VIHRETDPQDEIIKVHSVVVRAYLYAAQREQMHPHVWGF